MLWEWYSAYFSFFDSFWIVLRLIDLFRSKREREREKTSFFSFSINLWTLSHFLLSGGTCTYKYIKPSLLSDHHHHHHHAHYSSAISEGIIRNKAPLSSISFLHGSYHFIRTQLTIESTQGIQWHWTELEVNCLWVNKFPPFSSFLRCIPSHSTFLFCVYAQSSTFRSDPFRLVTNNWKWKGSQSQPQLNSSTYHDIL